MSTQKEKCAQSVAVKKIMMIMTTFVVVDCACSGELDEERMKMKI